jgi:transcriptional regulator with XRE-family HTH domain
MHPLLKLLGRNVRRLRVAREMTPERLARKADVSVYVLGRIETGKGNPGIDAVFRLARGSAWNRPSCSWTCRHAALGGGIDGALYFLSVPASLPFFAASAPLS